MWVFHPSPGLVDKNNNTNNNDGATRLLLVIDSLKDIKRKKAKLRGSVALWNTSEQLRSCGTCSSRSSTTFYIGKNPHSFSQLAFAAHGLVAWSHHHFDLGHRSLHPCVSGRPAGEPVTRWSGMASCVCVCRLAAGCLILLWVVSHPQWAGWPALLPVSGWQAHQ